MVATSELSDTEVVAECNVFSTDEDSYSVTDNDVEEHIITSCCYNMDDESPGSVSMSCDPDEDDYCAGDDIHTVDAAPVSLIVALTDWALQHDIPKSALRSLLGILKPLHNELPLDPRTLLKTPTRYLLKNMSGGQGKYYHFGISAGIRLEKCPDGPNPLLLQFNVDGLPLFKSSSTELWPILCHVKNSQLEPFIVGLYCGKKKPADIFEYLEDFVTDLSQVLAGGVTQNALHRNVELDCFVCDAPARAYLKNVKTFSGYYGCDKCSQEGEYVEGKVTFPLTNAPLRTDADFNNKINEEHHHGPTPLSGLQFGLVSGFAIDYMHLVCLGVVRRLVNFWLRGPIHKDANRAGRLPASAVAIASQRLVSLCDAVPREFARKPRTLNELDRWKATEFRQLLLYTGPVVFFGILSTKVFNHFMLLSVGISLLCDPVYSFQYNQYAHSLLTAFVEQSAEIYGRGFMVYNVHCLVHLAADVQLHGNLDSFSAFRFENFLRQLKQMVRKADSPLPQIVRRIGEKCAAEKSRSKCNKDLRSIVASGEHSNGPRPAGFVSARQYSRLTKAGMVISLDDKDCCILTESAVPRLVRNILLYNSSYFLVCQSFGHIADLFLQPLPSSGLGIYRVSQLRSTYTVVPLTERVKKSVCLPTVGDVSHRTSEFAVIPLLHTGH